MGVGAWGSVMEASIMSSSGGLKMNPQQFCSLKDFMSQVVNEATTWANEATRSAAQRGLGAHQLLLEGHGQRFAGSAGGGWRELFFVNTYATHRRRRTLRVWRSTTWTLATGSSAASTTSTPLSNPPALASPKPARSAPSSCRWHSLAVHDSVVHHSPSLPTLDLSSGPGGTPSGGGPVRIRKMALSRSGCCSSSIAAAIAIARKRQR